MADEFFFRKFKEPKVILNSSRGEVVKNDALKLAIKEAKVRFATLDVWENEPELDLELLNLVNISTPHIAGYSVDGKALGTAMSVRGLSDFFNLDLGDWSATNLPEPKEEELQVETFNLDNIIKNAIRKTYNIMADDSALRETPSSFELLRGNYPVRREFFAYKVPKENKELIEIGFQAY